jgi:hypothetical protein
VFKNKIVNVLLLLGLVGLLIAYVVVVNDLPARVYSVAQQAYLDYNLQRSISQSAPTWNYFRSGDQAGVTLLPGQKSHVQATLTARYEEQAGVSVPVYDLDFRAEYHLAYPGPLPTTVELIFPFPDNLENLHQVRFAVDGEEPPETHFSTQGIAWQTTLEGGEKREIVVSYRANGANSFSYGLHHGQRSDVDVTFTVMGLTGSEASENTLPFTAHRVDGDDEVFVWNYEGLIAERDIQIELPSNLSFTQRVARLQDDFQTLSRMAPLLVGLFVASLAGVLHLGDVRLKMAGYLLAGCAVALFYPLFTFLSGVLNIAIAGVLALSLVSGVLLPFLVRVTGQRRVWWRAGLLLLVFLGLFSLGALAPWRGLLLTGGGLALVGNFMSLYVRRPAAPEPEPTPLPVEVPPAMETEPDPVSLHCVHCATPLADEYSFCPGCGHDTSRFRHCAGCGHQQYVPEQVENAHCTGCGRSLDPR